MKLPFFRNFPPVTQLFVVLTMYFTGTLLALQLVQLMVSSIWHISISPDLPDATMADVVRLYALLAPFLVFITPATIFRKYMEFEGQDYLRIRKAPSLKTLGTVLLVFILCFPVSNFLYYVNFQLDPAYISPQLGESLKVAEKAENSFNQVMFGDASLWKFLISLVSVGFLAAFGEELIYRSIIQRLFTKMSNRPHLAILIMAIVFSLMHMSYFGFLPRVFMGIVLGYIYLCTANIWYSIIFHFLNNGISITLMWLSAKGYDFESINMFGFSGPGRWVALVILVILTAFAFTQLNRIIRKDFVEEIREY